MVPTAPLHSRISASSAIARRAKSLERTGGGGGGTGGGEALELALDPGAWNVSSTRFGSIMTEAFVNCTTVSRSIYERPPICTTVPESFPFTTSARPGALCAHRMLAKIKTDPKEIKLKSVVRFLMVFPP